MYKILIAVSIAFVTTFVVSQRIGEARHEQERQRKQAEVKLEQEQKRAEREQEQEREREAEQRRALEREDRERKRALEAQRKLEVQRKQEREAQRKLQERESQRKLEAQRKRDEKIAYERKVQQEQLEAAAELQQQQKDEIIEFNNRLRLVVIDRKKRAKEWRLALDQEWYRTQRFVGTPGTATDQEAFDRMQRDLYKKYGELSAYEKVTEELDNYSRGLSEAIFGDNWEEANRLYRAAQGIDDTRPNPGGRMEPFRPDWTALEKLPGPINLAMRANVLIETRGGPRSARSLGSGVIMKISGGEAIILTNRHVVDAGFSFNSQAVPVDKVYKSVLDVTLIDQRVVPGQVTWIAPSGIDLALVRIQGATPDARAARWKIGRSARVGDRVFAIGNPLGLGWTHTQGTISQFRIKETGDKAVRIIQTQTALNPGNSGGGLYDEEGYLIGINTWARDKRVAEGLNFAISLDALKTCAPAGLILQD